MTMPIKRWLKQLQFLTPFRRSMVHHYDYFFWPAELAFLCEMLEIGIEDGGIALEVGCAQGASTVFLNNHITWAQRYRGLRDDVEYVCLDTFSGFTREHALFERQHRGKADVSYDAYRINSPEWFQYMLDENGVKRVDVHEADAAVFDYSSIGPIGFALLDVDLYLPTKAALPRVFAQMKPGGVIVVDDCAPEQDYDGARQAYLEFMAGKERQPEIHHRKFGIIRT
jgi:O-methyltransferase